MKENSPVGGSSEKGPERLLRKIPPWIRWILVVPAALVGDYLAQGAGQLIISLQLSTILGDFATPVLPFAYAVLWHTASPLLFVAFGMQVAPSRRLLVCYALCTLKIVVLLYNSYSVLLYAAEGGAWSRVDSITKAPTWWNLIAYLAGVAALIGWAWLWRQEQRTLPGEADLTRTQDVETRNQFFPRCVWTDLHVLTLE